MSGFAPLKHTEIRAWAENTHRCLSALEIDGLIALDTALRDPGCPSIEDETDETPTRVPTETPAWPSKKSATMLAAEPT